jgi:prolyl oligopeptidase
MFIVCKKGIELNGNNPTLLYAYGGFNISITPSFSTSKIAFLEQGGIYVVANLRGGGEYGEDWHKAGMLEKKQNVFDDFIAAAEYLIKEKYTSADKLAIQGRSNGGLLIGAVMTQRPDLFKVALPGVGVLDMLRYHKSTVGWGWSVEYGNSDNQEQFKYLVKYSPLHNIKDSVKYPATLVTTGDHDDRVVPSHSFKFIATLQAKAAAKNPTIPYMVRIDTNAGHGAGKPTSKLIEEEADVWAFTMFNLGMLFE